MVDYKHKSVAVIGLGYVGLPLLVEADKRGYRAIGIDCVPAKVELIQHKQSPFYDELLQRDLKNSTLDEVTTDYAAIERAKTVVITVPTPTYIDHRPDYRPLESVAESIAPHVRKGHLIIVESTVNPGATEKYVGKTIEAHSRMKLNRDFSLAYCPERINPGDQVWTMPRIPRIVGASNEAGLERAVAFYRSVINDGDSYEKDGKMHKIGVTRMSNIRTAEYVKVFENSCRDVDIAVMNAAMIYAAQCDVDMMEVLKGMETKPFSYFRNHLHWGFVGGHCIKDDPYFLIEDAKERGSPLRILEQAREVNNSMPSEAAKLVQRAVQFTGRKLTDVNVALLGLSFKENVSDVRNSGSFPLADLLFNYGVKPKHMHVYDPHVSIEALPPGIRERVQYAPTLEDALVKADVIVLTKPHDFARQLTGKYVARMNVKVAVDLHYMTELDAQDYGAMGIPLFGFGRKTPVIKSPPQIIANISSNDKHTGNGKHNGNGHRKMKLNRLLDEAGAA